jgi:SH3-like domain-containing protein
MAMNTRATAVPLRRRPQPEAAMAAYLNPRALAALDRCKAGWCRIRVDGISGWAPEGSLWGTSPAPQCR